MENSSYRILFVEKDSCRSKPFVGLIRSDASPFFETSHVTGLADALTAVATIPFDGVVLIFDAIDSYGLDAVRALAMSTDHSMPPLVVLARNNHSLYAVPSIKLGAADFVVEDASEGDIVSQGIQYAIERHKFAAAQADARSENIDIDDSTRGELLVTARAYGAPRWRDAALERFHDLVAQHRMLITAAIEERHAKVNRRVAGRSHNLASNLEFLHATSRELADVHAAAMKEIECVNSTKATTLNDKVQLILIKVLELLANHYRSFAQPSAVNRKPVGESAQ